MATTRSFRPWLDYIAALLVFGGMTALLITVADVFDGHEGWLLFTGIVGTVLGFTLQQRGIREPLQPGITPRTIWWLLLIGLLASLLVLPRVDWQGPWLVVMFLIAATIGALTSVVFVLRHQAIQQQYHENNEISGGAPSDTGTTKSIS